MSINATRLGLASKLLSCWPHVPALLGQAFAVPPIRLPLPVITGEISPPQGSLYLAVDPIFVWTPSSINSNHHHRLDLPNETSLCPLRTVYHTILLAASAWTPGAAGVGMASRCLSEHWMALQPAVGGTARAPASALQWATPAALLLYHARPNLCRHVLRISWCDQAVTLVCPSRHHTLWAHRRPIGCDDTMPSWDFNCGTIGPGSHRSSKSVRLQQTAPCRATPVPPFVPRKLYRSTSQGTDTADTT